MIGRQITQCYRSFSAIVDDVLWHMVQRGRFPPLNPACLGPNVDPVPSPTRSAHTDPLTEGFGILNAVPKNRRNWTRRMCRKFGAKGWGQYKYPVMNRKLRLDHKTGEYFRLGLLPMGTYQKIRDETLAIQERMKESFGFQPKDKEVIIMYENEQDPLDGQRKVVEMPKERPSFFSSNLIERVNQTPGDTSTVRPTGLG